MLTAGPSTLCELARLDSKAYIAFQRAVEWVWLFIGRDEGYPCAHQWSQWDAFSRNIPLGGKNLFTVFKREQDARESEKAKWRYGTDASLR